MSPFLILLGVVALLGIVALLAIAVSSRRSGPTVTTIETRRVTRDEPTE